MLETEGQVVVVVTRSGDINQRSKVRCFTRQASADVGVDYVERPDTDASAIEFLPGKKIFCCCCCCCCCRVRTGLKST